MKQKEQHAIFSVVIKKLEEAKIVADILDSMDEVVLTIGFDKVAATKGVSPLQERISNELQRIGAFLSVLR